MSLTISDAGVDVFITRETRAPTQQGFGTLLFLNPVGSVLNRIKQYTSLAGVAADYNAEDAPYKAATSFYSQSPQPVNFAVGEVLEGSPFVPGIHASGTVTFSAGPASSNDNIVFDIDDDTYTVTGITGEVAEAAAVGKFDISGGGNAAGDGVVGLSLNGVDYLDTPTASDTPTVVGDALVLLIDAGGTHTAVNTLGSLSITAVVLGSAGNLVLFDDKSTDTGTGPGIVTAPSGGKDAVVGTTADVAAELLAAEINTGSTHTATYATGVTTITDVNEGVAGNDVVFAYVSGPTGLTEAVVQPASGTDDIHATPGENLSDALDNMVSLDANFYFIGVSKGINDDPESDNVASWAEANERLFFAVSADPNCLILGESTSVMERYKVSGYDRTMVSYSTDEDAYLGCSAAGKLATTAFRGTDTLKTLKFKDMPGVNSENISADQLNIIKGKNGNVFYETAGIRMFDEGKTAGGSWVDEIHGMDALAEEIRIRVFGLLSRVSTKVPYNEKGMSQLEAEVEGALGQYVTNGFLTSRVDAEGDILPAYDIWHLPVINASSTDKANRIAPDIEFTARLAGAIHEVTVNGVLVLD